MKSGLLILNYLHSVVNNFIQSALLRGD